MIGRVLSKDEWGRLDVTELPQISSVKPKEIDVVVVEHDGKIVASMEVLRVTHFESLWIDPEHRGNPALARQLLKTAITSSQQWEDRFAWGASATDHMSDILERVGGTKLPIESFILALGDN